MASDAVQRAKAALDAVDDDASFVVLVGDEHGMDATLEAGDHEPTAVHIHLLATHIQALADVLDEDVGEVTDEAVQTYHELEAAGAVAVSERLDEDGGR